MKLWRYPKWHRKRWMKKEGRRDKTYARLATAIPIGHRPDVINQRKRLGDWESDNMEGKRSDATSVSVTVDRLSRKVRLRNLADHTAKKKQTRLLCNLVLIKRVDRGPENSEHEQIAEAVTDLVVYGCEPYQSWEKESV